MKWFANLVIQASLKADRLVVHIAAGIIIGCAFIARLILKLASPLIVSNSNENLHLDRIATWVHRTIYILVFSVALSGLGIAIQIDMQQILAFGETMPLSLSELPIRKIHGRLTTLLTIIIGLHVLAALFHQFVLKDRLLFRMWIGKKK
ncbi:cytochrome b/b6 domain-containing protein [Vibrio sp. DW001]|uniref:cytochrome b n=1 Tax=Vibrio sp. DW001 TaxID=2912315 RepID=UPI0023B11764|nr:cytochrome b/b6 domain-containing protein [Vibrio sp. DW001]WED28980.1 cytochrome b/b6 domain-containing protein [Vibrio sp. DW001]